MLHLQFDVWGAWRGTCSLLLPSCGCFELPKPWLYCHELLTVHCFFLQPTLELIVATAGPGLTIFLDLIVRLVACLKALGPVSQETVGSWVVLYGQLFSWTFGCTGRGRIVHGFDLLCNGDWSRSWCRCGRCGGIC